MQNTQLRRVARFHRATNRAQDKGEETQVAGPRGREPTDASHDQNAGLADQRVRFPPDRVFLPDREDQHAV